MVLTPNCNQHILLAEDDEDDLLLFEDALKEICPRTRNFRTASNGLQLMKLLSSSPTGFPDIIFLDLNMPLKNGFQCLEEIKRHEKLKEIPVVIFSTAQQSETIDKVYEEGANLYIRKPGSFSKLKDVIARVLSMDWKTDTARPPKESFVL